MKVRPIKTKKDYEATLYRVEELMDARKNTPEGDELEILSTLVEAYEEEHFPIDDPDPIEAIRHSMEALGMESKDLIPLLGSKSRVSEIMNRRRKLSMEMVRKLNQRLKIPADILIRDYPLRKNSGKRTSA